jgi:hypothetical protein
MYVRATESRIPVRNEGLEGRILFPALGRHVMKFVGVVVSSSSSTSEWLSIIGLIT